MIKPAYSVSFLLSINIFVWQNVLYFLDAPRRTLHVLLIVFVKRWTLFVLYSILNDLAATDHVERTKGGESASREVVTSECYIIQ